MIRQEEGSGEHVSKFPDVPRPRIGERARVKRGERRRLGRFVGERCLLVQKVPNEQRNIGTPFSKGRESKLKNVQTIEQSPRGIFPPCDRSDPGSGRWPPPLTRTPAFETESSWEPDRSVAHLPVQEPKEASPLRMACQTIHLIEEERPALALSWMSPCAI